MEEDVFGEISEFDELMTEARTWDRRYLEVTIHCIEYCNDDVDKARELIDEFLSYQNRGAFHLTNPHSKKLWLSELLEETLRHKRSERKRRLRRRIDEDPGDKDIVYAMVTFTHKGWVCCDNNIIFDLARAKQKVRNALPGIDFMAVFEAAPYINETWVTGDVEGKLISFHCHALVQASSISKLQRARKFAKQRFEPILGKKSGMRLERVREKNVGKVVRYMAKMLTLGYQTERRDGRTRQRSAKISLKSRHKLFQTLKNYTIFDFWFAGGKGRAWLSRARTKLKRAHKPKLRLGPPRPPRH